MNLYYPCIVCIYNKTNFICAFIYLSPLSSYFKRLHCSDLTCRYNNNSKNKKILSRGNTKKCTYFLCTARSKPKKRRNKKNNEQNEMLHSLPLSLSLFIVTGNEWRLRDGWRWWWWWRNVMCRTIELYSGYIYLKLILNDFINNNLPTKDLFRYTSLSCM